MAYACHMSGNRRNLRALTPTLMLASVAYSHSQFSFDDIEHAATGDHRGCDIVVTGAELFLVDTKIVDLRRLTPGQPRSTARALMA